VSIARGARVEIKGVQALDLIETIVEREVERQVNLLEIMDELQKRSASVQGDIIDVTHLFVKTQSEVIKKALKKGVVLAVNLHGFAGLVGREIQPGRRLGSELSDYAKKSGVGGIFHTDELPAYGITAREIEALRQALDAKVEDCVVLVADLKERAFSALGMVVDRSRFAMTSVPEETRKALPDGNSAYMRPLPGAARMYPETDVPPVVVTHEMLHDIALPELLPARKGRYMKDHSLNKELAERVAFKHFELFEDILSGMGDTEINVTLIASTLVNTLTELRREGIDVNQLDTGQYVDIFKLIASGDAAKEVVPELLSTIIAQPGISAQDAAQQLGLGTKHKEDIETMVDEIISRRMDFITERGLGAVGPLMGLVMKEMRGSVDGKVVSDIVTEKIKNILS
jgi:glutamyl-tRNA(Gln) amidotransferase subunit E